MVASLFSGPVVYAHDRDLGPTVGPAEITSDSGKRRNLADDFFDDTGIVALGGRSASGGSLLVGSPESNRVAIEDNEVPLVSVSAAGAEVIEGQDVVFRFTRLGSQSDDLSVGLYVGGHQKMMTPETKSITLNSMEEGTVVDTTVTFEPGEGEVLLRLTTHDDNVNEGDGLLTVRIARSSSSLYRPGKPRKAEVLVRDNDIPTVSIRMPELPTGMTLSESGDTWEGSLVEGQEIGFTLACSGDYEYTPLPDAMRTYFTWIAEMNHPGFFSKHAVDRGRIGNNQTGYSQITSCDGRTVPDPMGARRRFVGPDGGEVRIDIVPANVEFSQTLRELKLEYRAAQEEAERLGVPLSGLGLFAGVNDTFGFHCDDEREFCPRYEIGSPSSIRVKLMNRDPVILIAAEADEVTEGQPARFILERLWNEENLSDTTPGWADTLVFLATEAGGTQVVGAFPAEITFGMNETLKVIEVATSSDQASTDDGFVTVAIRPDTTGPDQNLAAKYTTAQTWLGHTPPGGRSDQATVTVKNDDEQALLLGFGEVSYTVSEGGTVEVVVLLSADPGRELVVPLSVQYQGGVSAADYSGVPASVTFGSGETEKAFVFAATQDMVDDDSESVVLGFGTLPTGVMAGTTSIATVNIMDDDERALLVGFGEVSYAVSEGGTVEVVVLLSADPGRELVIPLSIEDQGGVSVADYSGIPLVLTFAAGETEQTFVFSATQDMVDDDGEAVVLGFGTLPAGVAAGPTSTSTVAIADDDVPGVVTSPETLEISEGESGTYMVVLATQPTGVVTIEVNDPSNTDITAEPETLTFAVDNWDQAQMVTVYADEDDDPEDESDEITHGVSGGGYRSVDMFPVVVTVLDDDQLSDCPDVWCATVEFADQSATDWGYYNLFYHRFSEPPSSLSHPEFEHEGRVYTVTSMYLSPGIPPDSDGPPTGIQTERSKFFISILPGRWGQVPDTGLPETDYLNWTLHIGGVDLPLRDSVGPTTSDGRRGLFVWKGPIVQGLFSEWPVPTTYDVWIEETPNSGQRIPLGGPGAPRYLQVVPGHGDTLLARWWVPTDDGGSEVTGYRVEWKEAGDSWGDPDAVSEIHSAGSENLNVEFITGLTEGVDYAVRIIAINDIGAGSASEEYPGRPQVQTPEIAGASVDGDTLALKFDRMLDRSSVPEADAFEVLVNGGLRFVSAVSIQDDAVRLSLSPAVSAADEVQVRYLPPTDLSDPSSIRDIDGNLAISLEMFGFEDVRNETDRARLQPLSARFVNRPDSHNGVDSFTFRVRFSDSVWVERGTPRVDMVVVTGGSATSGWWLDRHTGLWEFTVRPDSNGDVTIVLPANRACGTVGAPCASGDRRLSNRLELTVQGPDS